MALDFRDQYFGCEIEMTGLTRQQAARTLAELFGTSITHYGGTYDGYRVADREGKDWKIVSDGSINAFRRSNGRQVPAGREYRVEMNSPKLEYAEMEKLQEVVRALRHAGAFVNDSCGMHVHIDAARDCYPNKEAHRRTHYPPFVCHKYAEKRHSGAGCVPNPRSQ